MEEMQKSERRFRIVRMVVLIACAVSMVGLIVVMIAAIVSAAVAEGVAMIVIPALIVLGVGAGWAIVATRAARASRRH